MLTMDGSENVDLRIKQISDEMLQLRQMKKRAELDAQQDMGRENKVKEIMELISAENLDLTEYSDSLVYQVIERVTVLSKDAGSLGAVGVSLCLLFSLRNRKIGDINLFSCNLRQYLL